MGLPLHGMHISPDAGILQLLAELLALRPENVRALPARLPREAARTSHPPRTEGSLRGSPNPSDLGGSGYDTRASWGPGRWDVLVLLVGDVVGGIRGVVHDGTESSCTRNLQVPRATARWHMMAARFPPAEEPPVAILAVSRPRMSLPAPKAHRTVSHGIMHGSRVWVLRRKSSDGIKMVSMLGRSRYAGHAIETHTDSQG